MQILVVTNLYPRPGRSVAAPRSRQQFAALRLAGHEVSVVAPVLWTEELRDRLRGHRTPARRLAEGGMEVRHPVYFYTPKMLTHLYGEYYQASVGAAFRAAVREDPPDVVLACFAHPDGWAAVRLARRQSLPVVIKTVGTDVLGYGRHGPRGAKLAQALREADGVVAVSRHLREHIVSRIGVEPERVAVVYNGLDTSLFRPGEASAASLRASLGLPATGRVVLFVGNVLMSKGAGVLAEACALLAARGEEFTCYLVGRGRDEGRVRALVARRGLAGRVVLAGARPFAELPDWYRAADVVALPSFSEGIPQRRLRDRPSSVRPAVRRNAGRRDPGDRQPIVDPTGGGRVGVGASRGRAVGGAGRRPVGAVVRRPGGADRLGRVRRRRLAEGSLGDAEGTMRRPPIPRRPPAVDVNPEPLSAPWSSCLGRRGSSRNSRDHP